MSCTCAGDVWSGRMEGDVEDALVELLPVGGHLLHARLTLKVPHPSIGNVIVVNQCSISNAMVSLGILKHFCIARFRLC